MVNSSVTLALAVGVSLEPWSPHSGEDCSLQHFASIAKDPDVGYFIGYGNSQTAFEKRILRKVIWL